MKEKKIERRPGQYPLSETTARVDDPNVISGGKISIIFFFTGCYDVLLIKMFTRLSVTEPRKRMFNEIIIFFID